MDRRGWRNAQSPRPTPGPPPRLPGSGRPRTLGAARAILYHTIPYFTIPYHTVLYYTTLYYTILYFTTPAEDPRGSSGEFNVRVAVRVRPLLARELQEQGCY